MTTSLKIRLTQTKFKYVHVNSVYLRTNCYIYHLYLCMFLFTQTEHISYNQQSTCKFGVTNCEYKIFQESNKIEGYFLNLEKAAKKMKRKLYNWVLKDEI